MKVQYVLHAVLNSSYLTSTGFDDQLYFDSKQHSSLLEQEVNTDVPILYIYSFWNFCGIKKN